MSPAPKNNGAVGYQDPVKIETLKGAGLLIHYGLFGLHAVGSLRMFFSAGNFFPTAQVHR